MRTTLGWIIILIFCIINLFANYFAKTWILNHKIIFYIIAVLLWSLTNFLYMPLLKIEPSLITTSIVWLCVSLISSMLIGVFTGEVFTVSTFIALILSIVSIVLSSIK